MNVLNDFIIIPLREETWDADWKNVQGKCPKLSDWGCDLLKDGFRGSARCVINEPEYICKDHRNLHSQYYSKKHKEISAITSRLHFFSCEISAIEEVFYNGKSLNEFYLGYVVIRPISERSLGRTVIDPYKLNNFDKNNFDKNNFFCLRSNSHIHLGGIKLSISGYPYMSQDRDITVCAHIALWGMCRYLSQKYQIYREFLPFDIIRLTSTSEGRTFPYRGMTYSDYCKILSDFGCYPSIIRLKKTKDTVGFPEEFKNLYSYVESGFPVLGSFSGHVATLIGHTIDYTKLCNIDKNKAEDFIDSSFFLKQFIVIDDNFFPYQLLGYKSDPKNYGKEFPGQYSIESLVTGICPLPEKVFLPAERARKIGLDYLNGLKDQLTLVEQGPWVIRLFLTTNSSFKR
jgi:hypothetical protein